MDYDVRAALAGKTLGPALRVMLLALLETAMPQVELYGVGTDAGVKAKTVENQLSHLRKAGYLWVTGRPGERTWGLTPFGEDLARSLGMTPAHNRDSVVTCPEKFSTGPAEPLDGGLALSRLTKGASDG